MPFLQAKVATRVAGDDRGDGLTADIQRYFGKQSDDFNLGDVADELVSAVMKCSNPFGNFNAGDGFFFEPLPASPKKARRSISGRGIRWCPPAVRTDFILR